MVVASALMLLDSCAKASTDRSLTRSLSLGDTSRRSIRCDEFRTAIEEWILEQARAPLE